MPTTVYIIIICILLIFVLPISVTRFFMRKFLRRYDMSEYSFSLRLSDMTGKYEPRIIRFPSRGNTLCGYVFGEENTGGLVIFCHGLFGGAEEYFAFAKHFVDEGFAVFTFDNTGCNRSEGNGIKGPMQGLYDLNSAVKYLKAHEPGLFAKKKALVGHSWGGFTVAAYKKMSDISCVVSLAGFDRAAPAVCDFLSGAYGNVMKLILPCYYMALMLQYGKNFNTSAVKNINRTEVPYLIVQGTNDKIIHHDSSSLYNHRRKIKNKNVKFILRTDEKHNKHNTIYRDADATAYLEEQAAKFRAAKRITDENLRKCALMEIFEQTDRERINRLDAEIMAEIDAVLEKYLQ